MDFAPKRDWKFYEQSVAMNNAVRTATLSPEERFEIYANYFDTLRQAKQGIVDQDALDRNRWIEKLAMRDRQVKIFHAMDDLKHG